MRKFLTLIILGSILLSGFDAQAKRNRRRPKAKTQLVAKKRMKKHGRKAICAFQKRSANPYGFNY